MSEKNRTLLRPAKFRLALAALSVLFILGMALSVFFFAWDVNPDHLQGDQWRWMREVVVPYREGKISLFEALTYEFAVLSHTHILTLGEMLLNERLFGLNQHLSTLIGTLSLFGCVYLFWRYLRREDKALQAAPGFQPSQTPFQTEIWYWGSLCIAAAAFFAIGPYAAFTWSLVTFENLYLLMAFGLLFGFHRFFLERKLAALIGLMAFTFLLGDAMGTAAVLATLVMACLLTINDRSYWKLAALYIGSFILIVAVAKFTLTGRVAHSPSSSVEAFIFALTHPAKTLDFLFTGLGRGVVSSPANTNFKGVDIRGLTIPVGIIIFLCGVLLSAFTLYKKRLRENVVPFLLLGFTIISIVGVIRLRIMIGDSGYMFGDRYYRFLMPFFLGTVLLARDVWREHPSKGFTTVFCTGTALYLIFGIWVANHNWNTVKPFIERHFASWDESLIDYARAGDPAYMEKNRRCRNDYCKDSIAYLDARELSTFRASESPGNQD